MSSDRSWYPLTGTVDSATRSRALANPVDPNDGPQLAIAGRIVTMNGTFKVLDDAIIYIEKGAIVAVQARDQPAPAAFASVPVIESKGTIYPGLIELHNHLSYNALPLWSPVPKRFNNRSQWPNHADYRPLVSGPMTVIGKHKVAGKFPLLAPLTRYVECKCLLGGVTTSQGVKLASNAGIQRFYRGIVRNVEQTDDPDLPEAQGRIPDLTAKEAARFLERLNAEKSCFLLHLSEGVTDPATPLSSARKNFLALEVAPNQWALNHTFTGIHAAGLLPEDFDVLARHGSSMVWSPMSNLLLYGGTARVEAARQAGVLIGLGSDWSPTGSKNLFGELKVAWLYNQAELNGLFKAREILAMATRDAAKILKWDKVAGSIKPGARADLLVIDGNSSDPYEGFLQARETDIRLVMINGVARYGWPDIMGDLVPPDQTLKVGGKTRRLFLQQASADPDVAPVTLSHAKTKLRTALKNISALAEALENPPVATRSALLDANDEPVWSLALDEVCDCGVEMAPRLPFNGPSDFTGPERAPRELSARAPALSSILRPIRLDPLTVADDIEFLDSIEDQPNLPLSIRTGLSSLY